MERRAVPLMLNSASPARQGDSVHPLDDDQLTTILEQCDERDEQERDELLRDLLVHVYPTRRNQDN
jgi:hypothetical protein